MGSRRSWWRSSWRHHERSTWRARSRTCDPRRAGPRARTKSPAVAPFGRGRRGPRSLAFVGGVWWCSGSPVAALGRGECRELRVRAARRSRLASRLPQGTSCAWRGRPAWRRSRAIGVTGTGYGADASNGAGSWTEVAWRARFGTRGRRAWSGSGTGQPQDRWTSGSPSTSCRTFAHGRNSSGAARAREHGACNANSFAPQCPRPPAVRPELERPDDCASSCDQHRTGPLNHRKGPHRPGPAH